MASYIEIRNINFDPAKKVSKKWKKEFFKNFPEAKHQRLESSEYFFQYLYDKAYPYDEDFVLRVVNGFSQKQMEKVYKAREMLKHFILSIERNDDYVGPGNNW